LLLCSALFTNLPNLDVYFTCFTSNTFQMGQLLARDRKLAQYVHLSPRCTFTIQIFGCLVGAVLNYVMMNRYALPDNDLLWKLILLFVGSFRTRLQS
jgi:hypothetical protein